MNTLEVELGKKSLELVIDFARRIGGPAADEIGIIFGNNVRAWRINNAYKIIEKAQRQLAEAGLPPNTLPPRLFLPFLEAASIEDNESLQEMWAALLATAVQSPEAVSPGFVETLKQMTPDEARYLNKIYDDRTNRKDQIPLDAQLQPGLFTERAGAPKGVFSDAYERLGLIIREWGLTEEGNKPEVGYSFRFTKYGKSFLTACRGPKKNSN